MRDANGIDHGALSGSAILELNADDSIRIAMEGRTNEVPTLTDYHLDVEFIGTTSDANVLRIYDSTGGLDIDETTQDTLIEWDVSDEIGSHFTFTGDTTPTDEITINAAGLYHISYAIDADKTVDVTNDRFKQRTSIQVDSGSGFEDALACFGDSFSRGRQTSPLIITLI